MTKKENIYTLLVSKKELTEHLVSNIDNKVEVKALTSDKKDGAFIARVNRVATNQLAIQQPEPVITNIHRAVVSAARCRTIRSSFCFDERSSELRRATASYGRRKRCEWMSSRRRY